MTDPGPEPPVANHGALEVAAERLAQEWLGILVACGVLSPTGGPSLEDDVRQHHDPRPVPPAAGLD